MSELEKWDDLGEMALSSLPHHYENGLTMVRLLYAEEAFLSPCQFRNNGGYLT